MPLSVALIEPDIAGNVGTILRAAACFGVAVHVVEPCGFAFGDRALKRAGMDYADSIAPMRHRSRADFLTAMAHSHQRTILLTTRGDMSLYQHRFNAHDVLLLGSESAGAPPDIHAAAAVRLHIPMEAGFRSLNVAVAAGIALAEARRQLLDLSS
jgi:tRNA (cytidine/uridine-2'-O-)-methyltransferase